MSDKNREALLEHLWGQAKVGRMYQVTDRDGLKYKRKSADLAEKERCVEDERRRERLSPAFEACGASPSPAMAGIYWTAVIEGMAASIQKLTDELHDTRRRAEARWQVLSEVREALKVPDGESLIAHATETVRELERRRRDVGP